jgi:uncharacterized membrane protein affecting hemolysin expression
MIEVYFKGPTETKGARWMAKGAHGYVFCSYDYSLGSSGAIQAAQKYSDRYLEGERMFIVSNLHGVILAATLSEVKRIAALVTE